MLEPWRIESSRITFEDRWLKVRTDRCVDRSGRVIEPYHVLEFPTWLNIVAVTTGRQLVLAREYRHGFGAILTGLPCGAMEPVDLDIEQGARRELEEETGYGGGECVLLSSNPANQTNVAASVLLLGVEPIGPRQLDPNEEIDVTLVDVVPFLARFLRREVPLQVSHVAALHEAALHLIATNRSEWSDLRSGLRAELGLMVQAISH